jgi:competence protein ComFC
MINSILDLILPQSQCCLCRKPGKFNTGKPWCPECQERLEALQECLPLCGKCGKYLETGGPLCRECRNSPPPYDVARAVGPYQDAYRLAIKIFKFMGRKYLGVRMGHMMAGVVKNEPRFWPIDLVVPVPISKGNLIERGFNQTEVLANSIARELRLKMDADILVRVKETPSQRELSREEREKNLLFAFAIKDKAKIYRKNVLLVDDVFTTGSTSKECTKVLLEGGAARVCVITWATGRGF